LYGTQKEWHKNGKLHFINTYKDGKKNGLETNYSFDGQKQNEGKYKDGKQDGLWSGWYNNGQLHFTSTYKDGKQDGLYTEWYSHRWKHGEGNYKDDKQEGLWTWWFKDGNIDKEEKYDGGYKIEETIYTYYKSGKKESKGTLTEKGKGMAYLLTGTKMVKKLKKGHMLMI
jgi:antitoxin component YwqK of YwqJK toxin-antitoxin module